MLSWRGKRKIKTPGENSQDGDALKKKKLVEEMEREKLLWLVEISHALWTLKRYDSFQVDLSNQSLGCIRKQIKHMNK